MTKLNGRIRTATLPVAKTSLIFHENFAFFREFQVQRLYPADAEPGSMQLSDNSKEAS